MFLGFHTSISPRIIDGLKYAYTLGATSAQIFLGSTQSSSLKSKQILSKDDILEVKTFIKDNKFVLSIHSIYLLNFCSFSYDNKRIKYAQDNLIYDLETGDKLGANCVVLHIGSKKELSRNEAYNNMANNILYVLKKIKHTTTHIKLLLETPAGQGTQIATTTIELSELYNLILNNSKHFNLTKTYIKARLGFCIDTAHIFSSGYAIRMPLGMNNYFKEFNKLIGLDKIGLIHLNDSKADINSRRDIHEGIGDGYIFNIQKIKSSIQPIQIKDTDYLQNLIILLSYSKKYNIPIILETHKAGSIKNTESSLYSQELGLLKSLWIEPSWIKQHTNKNWKLKHFYKSLKHIQITNKTKKQTNINTKNSKQVIPRSSNNVIAHNNNLNSVKSFIQYPVNIIIINKLKIIREYYQKVEKDNIRSLAYGKAILALKNFPEEIVNSNQLLGVKDLGPKIIKKIEEYLITGDMLIFKERDILNKLNKLNTVNTVNTDLKYNIKSILGFGDKKTLELRNKGIITYYDLLDAIKKKQVALNKNELLGLKFHKDLIKVIPRTESEFVFKNIKQCLSKSKILTNEKLEIELAGSYPSGKPYSKDIDILIFSNKIDSRAELKTQGLNIINKVIEEMNKCNILVDIISKGYGMIMCLIKGKAGTVRHLDIRLLPKKTEVYGRLFFTSGKDFNQILRQRAKSLGYKLNEFDLIHISNGKSVFTETKNMNLKETDIFKKLGYEYIPLNRRR